MRNAAVLAFIALAGSTLWAAVLPFDSAPSAGGARSLAHGRPAPVRSMSSAALGQSAQSYRGEWTADTRNTWRDNDGEPRAQFNLRTSAGDSRWGFGVRLRDLAGLPTAAIANIANDVQFSWTREAGTFRFSGAFDNGRGSGTYTFAPDQTFINNMASAGYKNLSTDDVVRLAVIDVTIAHVRGLAPAGYPNLSLDDLIRFRIHKVTPEFITALASRGYKNVDADDLVKMRIHNVTTQEMDELKTLGFGGIDIDTLVKFRIHKVTPEYIKSMKDVGFVMVSDDQLVRMRIHKVDAKFVRDARADGFSIVSPSDAVDLAIHGPRWKRRGF